MAIAQSFTTHYKIISIIHLNFVFAHFIAPAAAQWQLSFSNILIVLFTYLITCLLTDSTEMDLNWHTGRFAASRHPLDVTVMAQPAPVGCDVRLLCTQTVSHVIGTDRWRHHNTKLNSTRAVHVSRWCFCYGSRQSGTVRTEILVVYFQPSWTK